MARGFESDLAELVRSGLAEAVKKSGVRRAEVARRLKVPPQYVTMLLNDGYNLSLDGLARIAAAIGYRVEVSFVRAYKKR